MPPKENDLNYKLFFELSPDLLCIAGYDGYFRKINNSLSKLLGYSLEELYSRPINDFVYDEDKGLTSKVRNELIQNKPLYNFENRYIAKNGELIWLSWTSYPVPEEQLIFAIAKDITAKKNIEFGRNQLLTHLTQSNKDLKQLTYMTSHDLRTPVSNLLSVFNLLDVTKIQDEETLELIDFLKSSSNQLKETLDNYVDLLSENRNTYTHIEVVDLEQSLQEVLKTIDALLKTSQATMISDFSEVSTIKFNKTYLHSVFLNLITNAIKYTKPDYYPAIHITSKKGEGEVQLIVSDNGRGMRENQLEKSLSYMNGKEQDSTERNGIGLYLIHSHVTGLGGTVNIESSSEGTTFILSFKV